MKKSLNIICILILVCCFCKTNAQNANAPKNQIRNSTVNAPSIVGDNGTINIIGFRFTKLQLDTLFKSLDAQLARNNVAQKHFAINLRKYGSVNVYRQVLEEGQKRGYIISKFDNLFIDDSKYIKGFDWMMTIEGFTVIVGDFDN